MVDGAHGSTCLDTGEAIDGENLFKPDKLRITITYAEATRTLDFVCEFGAEEEQTYAGQRLSS